MSEHTEPTPGLAINLEQVMTDLRVVLDEWLSDLGSQKTFLTDFIKEVEPEVKAHLELFARTQDRTHLRSLGVLEGALVLRAQRTLANAAHQTRERAVSIVLTFVKGAMSAIAATV